MAVCGAGLPAPAALAVPAGLNHDVTTTSMTTALPGGPAYVQAALHYVGGHVGELAVVVSCVAAQHAERVLHADAEPHREEPFCLLDHDPAGQGGLQLLGNALLAGQRPLVRDPYGGGVGQGLAKG